MNAKGFSLLEILVAFTILAVSLSILLRIFSTGTQAAILSEEYNTAVQLAESLMATVGKETPLQAGEQQGDVADKYHWHIIITPMANHQYPKDSNITVDSEPVLMAVEVAVSWGDDDHLAPRSIELNTLKLAQIVHETR